MQIETIHILVEIMDHFSFENNLLNSFVFKINNAGRQKLEVLQQTPVVFCVVFFFEWE